MTLINSEKHLVDHPQDFQKKCNLSQWLVSLVLGCFNVNLGILFAIPGIAIGGLMDEREAFHITSFEASWFGSLPFIVITLGSIIAGFLQELMGRKGTLLLSHGPAIIGLVLLYLSNTVPILYLSAITVGFCAAFSQATLMSYSGEVFQPQLRGTLSSVQGVFFNIGYIVVCLFGAIFNWRTVVLICTIWPILTFFMTLWIPESPFWLAQKEKFNKGKAALCFLRGWTIEETILDEWNTILVNTNMKNNNSIPIKYETINQNKSETHIILPLEQKSNSLEKVKGFFSPEVQKPLLLLMIYFVSAICCCLLPTKAFLVALMNEMNISFDPYVFMFISAVLQFIGAAGFSAILNRFGKRFLTNIGFVGSVLTCFALGIYSMFEINITWLVILLFSMNSFIATFGILTIPWILVSEIFPLHYRGVASGITGALCNISMFTSIKTFVNIKLLLGISGSFILYGAIGLIGAIYLYINLPETEGKTLEEIETFFQKKSNKQEFKNKIGQELDV
uniref:Major facilitator superfamily (MFS) profile domain-containing protein n=1 Tax=Clastoptera arizonana TaxID=38151 RepID=A0A1B6BZ15_9HEMI